MKHIRKVETFLPPNSITQKFFQDDCIFFDIETTGFSPATSMIYLIGCLRKENDTIIVDQFLAETKEEEKELIISFIELLKDRSTIITFNGIGFDLPFIKAKCETYNIFEHFENYHYIDIFKLVNKIKPILKLPNYKQKTIETFLNIHREDIYSGGELIPIYDEYLISHNEESERLLLLHNYDDVLGMTDLLPILAYVEILNGAYILQETTLQPYVSFEGITGQEMIITLKNKYSVPTRVSHQYEECYLTMMNDITKIRIPLYKGTLKFFYPNYKDYYFLPKEDMAIHKSVASFVDKEFKEKAKACNCYTRKEGMFLPQFNTVITPAFRREYKDKIFYFEYSDDFITSKDKLDSYVRHIIKHVLSPKIK